MSVPVSYNVRLPDGLVWKRHQDQLRKCYIDTAESDVVVDVPTGDSPPAVVDTIALKMIPILLHQEINSRLQNQDVTLNVFSNVRAIITNLVSHSVVVSTCCL